MINLISLPDEKLKLELVKNNFNNYKIEYKIFDGIDGTNYVYTPDDTKYLKNVNFNIKKKKRCIWVFVITY